MTHKIEQKMSVFAYKWMRDERLRLRQKDIAYRKSMRILDDAIDIYDSRLPRHMPLTIPRKKDQIRAYAAQRMALARRILDYYLSDSSYSPSRNLCIKLRSELHNRHVSTLQGMHALRVAMERMEADENFMEGVHATRIPAVNDENDKEQ